MSEPASPETQRGSGKSMQYEFETCSRRHDRHDGRRRHVNHIQCDRRHGQDRAAPFYARISSKMPPDLAIVPLANHRDRSAVRAGPQITTRSKSTGCTGIAPTGRRSSALVAIVRFRDGRWPTAHLLDQARCWWPAHRPGQIARRRRQARKASAGLPAALIRRAAPALGRAG